MRKLLLFQIIFLFSLAVCADNRPETPEGIGTPEKPFLISKIEHLVWLSENLVQNRGKHFLMTADIDASETRSWDNGKGFLPIGWTQTRNNINNANVYQAHAFIGHFDGGGHTISNLYIDRKDLCATLFSKIGSADLISYVLVTNRFNQELSDAMVRLEKPTTVKNLALVNFSFDGKSSAAGLAASVSECRIENVYLSGRLESEGVASGYASLGKNSVFLNCETDIEFKNRYCQAAGFIMKADNVFFKNCRCLGEFKDNYAPVQSNGMAAGGNGVLRRVGDPRKIGPTDIYCVSSGTAYLDRCLILTKMNGYKNWDMMHVFGDSKNIINSFYSKDNLRDDPKYHSGTSNSRLMTKQNYRDWDFDNIWEIEEGKSFPKLRSIEKMLSGSWNK